MVYDCVFHVPDAQNTFLINAFLIGQCCKLRQTKVACFGKQKMGKTQSISDTELSFFIPQSAQLSICILTLLLHSILVREYPSIFATLALYSMNLDCLNFTLIDLFQFTHFRKCFYSFGKERFEIYYLNSHPFIFIKSRKENIRTSPTSEQFKF